MELTVLGSSGAYPTLLNPSSSYLVELAGFRILLDVGYATFPAMLKHTTAQAIDAVIVTHGHPDHCADLNPLLRARALGGGTPSPLPLYCPPSALDAVLALDRPGMLDPYYDLREFSPGSMLHIGPFTVDTRLLPHWLPNAGLRLNDSLVYTGDTGPSPLIADLAQGATTLIADASFPSHVPQGSAEFLSSALQAGQHATAAGVEKLVLTHVMPGTSGDDALAAARTTFDGEVVLASDHGS
ncbi:MAG TPA: MBL fold metallo-hydrolase [Candidatus Limnocylindrales bacterium]|nr:MBL fold metallo-hydrolase [Candidatus Limnocylindrales bacterium]